MLGDGALLRCMTGSRPTSSCRLVHPLRYERLSKRDHFRNQSGPLTIFRDGKGPVPRNSMRNTSSISAWRRVTDLSQTSCARGDGEPEVLMVPLPGHTPGSCGIAVRGKDQRLLYRLERGASACFAGASVCSLQLDAARVAWACGIRPGSGASAFS